MQTSIMSWKAIDQLFEIQLIPTSESLGICSIARMTADFPSHAKTEFGTQLQDPKNSTN